MNADKNAKNVVKIVCNPYIQKIEYYRWDLENNNWTGFSCESPFSTREFTEAVLWNKAYEIIDNMNTYYNTGNVGLDIIFEGTSDDFNFLNNVIDRYWINSNITIIKSNIYLRSAEEVKKKIEDIFNDMKTIFNKYPDNDISKLINQYTETVTTTIPICVMGLYSAGKSAFINSLIGVELLPSASDPTTAKTYKISSGEERQIKFYFLDDKIEKRQIVLSFNGEKYHVTESAELEIVKRLESIQKYNTIEERMYHALKIINSYDTKNEIHISNLIEVTLPIQSYVLPFDKFNFVFYDTPGSNSASNVDHIEILKEAMQGQTNGLPIFVTTPDGMDSNDVSNLIETLDKLGGTLDRRNLIVVSNKSDEKGKETFEKKKDNYSKLKISTLNPAGVYFVSSVNGLGFKKILSGNTKEVEIEDEYTGEPRIVSVPNFIDGDYSVVYENSSKIFKRKKEPIKLYEYNIAPKLQYDTYCELTVAEEKNPYRNSGLHSIEYSISEFAIKYALYNKCTNASHYLKNALNKLGIILSESENEQEEILKKLNEDLTMQEKELYTSLKEKCEENKSESSTNFSNEVLFFLKENINSVEETIGDKLYNIYQSSLYGEHTRGIWKWKKTYYYISDDIFIEKTKELLEKKIQEYWKMQKRASQIFWEKRLDMLKEDLVKIILNSKAITDKQKDIIKEKIIEIAKSFKYTPSLEVDMDMIFKPKTFRKNIVHYQNEEAVCMFIEEYEKGTSIANEQVISQSTRSFDTIIKDIKIQFNILIHKHNPKVIKLNAKLEECKNVQKIMRIQKERIGHSLNEINEQTKHIISRNNGGVL